MTVGDDFSGLSLQCNKVRTGPNIFSIESIAIATITAMKEEAREDYTATVREYTFTDTLAPQVPIRIVLSAAPGAADSMLKRSSVMWSIRALSIDLMRTRFFHPLLFTVKYHDRDLYAGVLLDPSNVAVFTDAGKTDAALPQSSSKNISSVLRGDDDQTQYQAAFRFVGERLSQFQIFRALLTALLQLAPSNAASVQQQIAMDDSLYLVWVFIRQVLVPTPGYTFQQYHAVALLEAAARYYVLHGQYMEMVFEIRMDGHLTATGCVTRAIRARRWCSFPEGERK
ncbi:MAG: hypothetical protein Q9199_001547 [Rusavskia elegans]